MNSVDDKPQRVVVDETTKFIYACCLLSGETLEQHLIDPPHPFNEDMPGNSMAFAGDEVIHLLYAVDPNLYPTVPSFVESFRFTHDQIDIAVPLDPLVAKISIGESSVFFVHPKAIFEGEYILAPSPSLGVPITPRSKEDQAHPNCNHSFVKKKENNPCVFSLWDLSSQDNGPRHFVIKDDTNKKAVIHSNGRIYSVSMPILVNDPSFRKGIFLELPISSFILDDADSELTEEHYQCMQDNTRHCSIKER